MGSPRRWRSSPRPTTFPLSAAGHPGAAGCEIRRAPASTTQEHGAPRYFFNVHDWHAVADQDGTDLPDYYAAQSEAIRMSGEILRDMGARFWDGTEWRLEVADERGRVLPVIRFSAEERALPTTPPPP
jgi:hypothetical protein